MEMPPRTPPLSLSMPPPPKGEHNGCPSWPARGVPRCPPAWPALASGGTSGHWLADDAATHPPPPTAPHASLQSKWQLLPLLLLLRAKRSPAHLRAATPARAEASEATAAAAARRGLLRSAAKSCRSLRAGRRAWILACVDGRAAMRAAEGRLTGASLPTSSL